VSSLDLSSGYSAEVILHELGHAVGLSHTHEGGLTALSARAKIVPATDRREERYVRRLSTPSRDTLA
jgi:predicted Zn-dependent protease